MNTIQWEERGENAADVGMGGTYSHTRTESLTSDSRLKKCSQWRIETPNGSPFCFLIQKLPASILCAAAPLFRFGAYDPAMESDGQCDGELRTGAGACW